MCLTVDAKQNLSVIHNNEFIGLPKVLLNWAFIKLYSLACGVLEGLTSLISNILI